MSRVPRKDLFSWNEVQVAHVWNRVVRKCFLLGEDPVSGKNYDHRKVWIVELLDYYARFFGIDLLEYALLSNHFHLILRSRPDVVATWYDTEVAFRWLMICPVRRNADGSPAEPSEPEMNAIVNDEKRLGEIRSRLSDFSWWVRLVTQRIAQRANLEDEQEGKFWQARYKASLIEDEASLLACSAYVNLNPIRAALAERVEDGPFTSIQRRLISHRFRKYRQISGEEVEERALADCHLSRFTIYEATDPVGPHVGKERLRCSDKGYLPMALEDYVVLLDWTARQRVVGKRGSTPEEVPPILERLSLTPERWEALVNDFPRLIIERFSGGGWEIKPRRKRSIKTYASPGELVTV